MKKNKKVIILILCILFGIGIILSSFFMNEKDKYEKVDNGKIKQLCDNINKEVKEKSDFVIFVTDKLEVPSDSNDVVNKYIGTYEKENKIFVIDFAEINNDCIKKILKGSFDYEDLKLSKVNTVIGYKAGVAKMSQSNIMDYISLEKVLDEEKIIKKQVIKETVTLKTFKENIKKDNYIFMILTEESSRIKFKNMIEEVFSGYDYDIVNYYSEDGKAIYDYLENRLDSKNVFPKIIYYSNEKLIKQDVVSTKEQIVEFKDSILK